MYCGTTGGRPITIVLLHQPIRHGGFSVACLEIPCPKPGSGRAYPVGLEHAELVVGAPADGMHGEAPLRAFMARQPSLRFQTGSIGKTINPDVSVHFTACLTPCVGDGDGPVEREVGIKFHARPLCDSMVKVVKVQALAAPLLGSCASSGRAWRFWAARHS